MGGERCVVFVRCVRCACGPHTQYTRHSTRGSGLIRSGRLVSEGGGRVRDALSFASQHSKIGRDLVTHMAPPRRGRDRWARR